ncbi:hypothetical protein HAZT_HAZT009001 [Hyalella azteca]|uniref:Novel acetylcholine receptor chaperone n=1 Tax=Hyalella azteca TaxID=294128 RepID=A0A6A0GTG9_HYAAZ|nr:hypothetical protein HAZT_HAZT009001 [Hyalella azteca]
MGLGILFFPGRVKQVANLTLVLMMLFATYNHWMVGDKFERIAPSLVFFFMLTCRLVVEFQIKRKEQQESKEKADKISKSPEVLDQAPSASAAPTGKLAARENRNHSGASNRTKKDD